MTTDLERVVDVIQADFMSDVERFLGLLHVANPYLCRDAKVVLAVTLSSGQTITVYSNVPSGFVGITTRADTWVDTPFAISAVVTRDDIPYITDSGVVNTVFTFRYWLVARSQWRFTLTNNAGHPARIHGAFLGYWLDENVWSVIDDRLKKYASRIATGGGIV
jgi:hypothetical protein